MQQYLIPIKERKVTLEDISYDYSNGKTVVIAQGYEQRHICEIKADGKEFTWEERRLVVFSIAHGKAEKKALQARIHKAQEALEALNQLRRGKKPFPDLESFVKVAESILSKNRVQSLFELKFQEQVEQIYQRRYGDRPARVIEKRHFQVDFSLNLAAVEQQMESLGWRVYATNHPEAELSLAQAVIMKCQWDSPEMTM
jgi:transposase